MRILPGKDSASQPKVHRNCELFSRWQFQGRRQAGLGGSWVLAPGGGQWVVPGAGGRQEGVLCSRSWNRAMPAGKLSCGTEHSSTAEEQLPVRLSWWEQQGPAGWEGQDSPLCLPPRSLQQLQLRAGGNPELKGQKPGFFYSCSPLPLRHILSLSSLGCVSPSGGTRGFPFLDAKIRFIPPNPSSINAQVGSRA